MNKPHKIKIIVEDDFGRAMTITETELSPPQLIQKIREMLKNE